MSSLLENPSGKVKPSAKWPAGWRMHALIFLNRIAVGWYLCMAGWGKVQNEFNEGVGSFANSGTYQQRTPNWLPDFIAYPYGYMLPWAELIVGALLVLGLWSRLASTAATLIFLSIGIALLGVGELLPRHHVMVFLTIALLLAATGPGRYSLDGRFRSKSIE